MWKILESIPRAARVEWFNCSKPAPHVVCRDEQHSDSDVTFRGVLNCCMRRTKAHLWRCHPFLSSTRRQIPTENQVTENSEAPCVTKREDDILAITSTDDETGSQHGRDCDHSQPLWSWGSEPIRRDESTRRRYRYQLTISSDSSTIHSVTNNVVDSGQAPPNDERASAHSCQWFRQLATSLGFRDSRMSTDIVAEAERAVASRAQRHNRNRWRHSFHHDFWSAFHQPYRFAEAVGWSTTLVLGLNLCDQLKHRDRQDNFNDFNTSWTSLLCRHAFSTNDGSISATCTVLPKTQLVNNGETTQSEKITPSTADNDVKEALEGMRKAADLYQNMTYNSEAIRLARAGRHANAFALWERAARSGYGKAHYNLALCYELGTAVSVDIAKAVEQYRLAAATGHAKAKYNLAILHRDGATGAGDTSTAQTVLTLLTEAAESGLVEAQLDLGVYLMEDRNEPVKSVECFQKAADNKNATAQCYLGMCYEHGLGVEKNLEVAADMYKKASRQGNALADLNLGTFYENGWGGVECDRQRALSLYEASSSHGEGSAVAEVKRLRSELEREQLDVSSDEDFAWMTDNECESSSLRDDRLLADSSPLCQRQSSLDWSSSEESEDEPLSLPRGTFRLHSLHTALAGPA